MAATSPTPHAPTTPERQRRALLHELAAEQDGLVTTAQAASLGLDRGALHRAVAHGWLEPVRTGLYAVAGAPTSWRRAVRTAVLSAGPDAVASHQTAAALWGLRGFDPGPVEVTTHRGRRRHTRNDVGFRLHESTDLRAVDVGRRSGFPCTTLVRTFIDLGASATELDVEDAFDDAVRRGLVGRDQVVARYRELSRRGRRGCGPIGRILERRDPNLERSNTFEKLLLRVVREAGLPEPVAQLRVDGHGWTCYLDFGWPDHRLAVECDSVAWHTGVRALQHDDERQNRLVLAGWTVLRFTWADLRDRPHLVAAQLRRALAA